ncbi:MAG TPA: PAS domain S-box protein [Bryobacteraceae bacterium]|nr:PAS domain S-box protein [Bryobacteraceae bacterium]
MSDSTPFIVVLIAVVILITAAAITLLNREESRYRKLHIAHENLSAWAYSLEECVGQAMITSDAHGRIHGYNTAAQELLGFSIDQVRGHSIFELIPLDGNGKSSRFNPAPDSAGRQVQAVRSDGSSIPVLLKVSQTRLGDQNLFRFLISDLRAAQEQERSQQENHIFRTALDSAGVMVALLSPEGRIIRLSRECADVLEVSPAEAEGNLFWEYFQRRSDWASAQAYFERAKVGALPTRLKATWITRTHRPIPLEWLILKPAWDKNGDLSHILAIAAPAAPRTNEDNQRALRSIEHVAGRLAGHFEDLLSTINGYSELVLHELDPASPLRRDVEQIVTASQRACDTTQQLITFSGQRLTLLEPVDLHAVLGTSPRIAVDADPFLPDGALTVLGNREALAEMLQALSENAEPGADGTVRLKLAQTVITDRRTTLAGEMDPGDYVSLRVSLGKVIDLESRAHLFEPFGSSSHAMGLATVYGLVRTCGGGISVLGTPETQSAVEILLPLIASPATGNPTQVKVSAIS